LQEFGGAKKKKVSDMVANNPFQELMSDKISPAFSGYALKKDRYEKAEPLLIEAFEGRRLKLGDTHPHTLESWNHLIDLYEAWNKSEKAEEWRTKLAQIEDF
jgi:hypothetical protein